MMLVPINPDVTRRETKWICVCPDCQHERIVSYAQKWNIEKGNTKDKCKKCQIAAGEINFNLEGLKIGHSCPEAKRKASETRRGSKRSNKPVLYRALFNPESLSTEAGRQKQRAAKLGKRGPLSNRWDGGKTSESQRLRSSIEYRELRILVLKRDNYSCQICSKKGKSLEMDHIKEWCNYPELRFEASNCRTLCHVCHKQTDNYAHKAMRKK